MGIGVSAGHRHIRPKCSRDTWSLMSQVQHWGFCNTRLWWHARFADRPSLDVVGVY